MRGFFVFRKHVCQYNIVQENCTTLGSMTELQNAAKAAATRPRIQPAEEGDDRPLSVSARLGRLQFHQSGKFRVLQLADIQDGPKVSKDTVKLIEASLDATRPDIVIFTGNQIAGYDPAYAQTTRKRRWSAAAGFPPKPLHPSLPKRQNGSKLRWNAPAHPCAPLSNSSCVRLPIAAFRGR